MQAAKNSLQILGTIQGDLDKTVRIWHGTVYAVCGN
jgi:hypothetical protein